MKKSAKRKFTVGIVLFIIVFTVLVGNIGTLDDIEHEGISDEQMQELQDLGETNLNVKKAYNKFYQDGVIEEDEYYIIKGQLLLN